MAGASIGDNEENPVAINVTAMVDVIFCLCVFFMCSLHFREMEGKFDTWLPKGKGSQGMPSEGIITEIRVAVFWDEAKQQAVRMLGTRVIQDDEDLQTRIKSAYDDFVRMNKPDVPVTIDAHALVPWSAIIDIVNICKREHIEKIEFAMGAAPPR